MQTMMSDSGSPVGMLSRILVVEASTTEGSVALLVEGSVQVERAVAMGAGRDDHLFPAIQSLLDESGYAPRELSGVVCGAGPGSFTSLRIAASLAKGLAHGAAIPLYAVSSLLLAAAAEAPALPAGCYFVHSDALRGERYVQEVEYTNARTVRVVGALRRVANDRIRELSGDRICLAVLNDPVNDERTRIVKPVASHLVRVWRSDWDSPVRLAQWEPDYGRLAEAQVKWEAAHGRQLDQAEST